MNNQIIFRKNGSSQKSIQTLREIFFSENQKKLTCLHPTPQYLAKYLAKMPAVKSYTNDGKLVRPKVNIEALKDLANISQELKIAVQLQKLQQLQIYEQETEEQVADYMKLREKTIDNKIGDNRLDLLGYIQAIENNAAMSSDGEFGLNGYAQIFKSKFQFFPGVNFDKEERAISEQIGNVADKIRKRFGEENQQ